MNKFSNIKHKEGKCKDCDYVGRLIAGRCQSHYWRHRSDKNKSKPQQVAKRIKKANLTTYFANQVLLSPNDCEECGTSIMHLKSQNSRSIVAHILAKRDTKYPSVATHPQNKMFLCLNCHSSMDNKGSEFIRNMKCFDEMNRRFLEVYKDLEGIEKSRAENEFNYFLK